MENRAESREPRAGARLVVGDLHLHRRRMRLPVLLGRWRAIEHGCGRKHLGPLASPL